MPHHEYITLTLMITLLASTTLATIVSPNAYAQQEMTPMNTFESHEEYSKLAFSADGNYLVAISNKTDTLTLFNRTHTLWSTHVQGINSIAISENATLIAAAADSGLYIFTVQNSTPQHRYNLNYPNPLIALSDDGTTIAYAATTTLYLIQTGNQNPTWNTTLQGTLESLSITGSGNYITTTTNHPGTLYLFSRQQSTPQWTYNLGEHSGAAKLSHNGEYLVATGGNQTSLRIHRFRPQSALPNYIKIISELASPQETAISAYGSIFAINQPLSKRLIFFNLNLPPYGYGPGSVLNLSLPSTPTATTMTLDGKYTAVGTDTGIYLYEYTDSKLTLTKQYTTDTPRIIDIALSGNGSYLAALGNTPQDSKNPVIYIFNMQKTRDTPPNPWLLPALAAISIITGSAILVYVIHRKQKPQKPTPTT